MENHHSHKRIGVQVNCLACHKDFWVRVSHPGQVLSAWANTERCQPCAAKHEKNVNSQPKGHKA